MFVERSSRFLEAYARLTDEQRRRVSKALALFAEDPRHPSLRVKRIQGTEGLWEGRASLDLRFTFEMIERGVRLRNVGRHDATLRSP